MAAFLNQRILTIEHNIPSHQIQHEYGIEVEMDLSVDPLISLFSCQYQLRIESNCGQIVGVAWKTQDATELEHAYDVLDGIEDEICKVPAF